MDYSALHHELHVDLNNVLDLQLVDLRSRVMRGEGKEQHLNRLRDGCVMPSLLQRDDVWYRYRNVQRVSSLLQSVKEHRPDGYEQFKKDRGTYSPPYTSYAPPARFACLLPLTPPKLVNHDLWATRPLTAEHLKYAAMDISMIATLYACFLSRKYITKKSLDLLLVQTARYITRWSDCQPPRTRNYFEQNPFLPLELIDDPTPSGIRQYQGGRGRGAKQTETVVEKKTCKKCKRELTQASFSKMGWTKTKCCWVCWAVLDNLRHWKMRDRMRQKKDEARARREQGQKLHSLCPHSYSLSFDFDTHFPYCADRRLRVRFLASRQRRNTSGDVTLTGRVDFNDLNV